MLALPWYGIGGVPPIVETAVEADHAGGGNKEEELGAGEVVLEEIPEESAEAIAAAIAALEMDAPPVFSAGTTTEAEHESHAQKRRARRKRAKDSAHKLSHSLRLKEKEEADFELPEDKAARVQRVKFDYSGASHRLRSAFSTSYLLSDYPYPSDDDHSIFDIAAACGAIAAEIEELEGEAAGPSTAP